MPGPRRFAHCFCERSLVLTLNNGIASRRQSSSINHLARGVFYTPSRSSYTACLGPSSPLFCASFYATESGTKQNLGDDLTVYYFRTLSFPSPECLPRLMTFNSRCSQIPCFKSDCSKQLPVASRTSEILFSSRNWLSGSQRKSLLSGKQFQSCSLLWVKWSFAAYYYSRP